MKKFYEFEVFLSQNKFLPMLNFKLIFLFVVGILWYLNYDFLKQSEFISKLVFLLFAYLFLNLVFTYGKLFFIHIHIAKNNLEKGTTDNLIVGIERVALFLNYLFFILLVINILIVNVRDLITSLSIVAVALVLIFKEYITNFLHGLNLMFSKNYRIRDTIKVGENKGKIMDLTFQNVEIKTDSGDSVYIPNTVFLTKEIINYSKSSLKNITVDITLLKENLLIFEEIKLELINSIFERFKNNIVNIENITTSYSKVEKDTLVITFSLYMPKYSLNVDKQATNYIIKHSMILLYNKIDENKKQEEQRLKEKKEESIKEQKES